MLQVFVVVCLLFCMCHRSGPVETSYEPLSCGCKQETGVPSHSFTLLHLFFGFSHKLLSLFSSFFLNIPSVSNSTKSTGFFNNPPAHKCNTKYNNKCTSHLLLVPPAAPWWPRCLDQTGTGLVLLWRSQICSLCTLYHRQSAFHIKISLSQSLQNINHHCRLLTVTLLVVTVWPTV